MAELKETNHTTEMFAAVRNDCEEIGSKDIKTGDFKLDKESLVLQNANSGVEIKSERKTRRSLLISLIIFIFLALCVIVIVLLVLPKKKKEIDDATCLSKNCVTVAARLIDGANLSVNPCKDFYEYACGGWKAKSFLPASQSEWNGFTSLREKTANTVKRIFDSKGHSSKNGSAVKKLFDFYHSCSDENQLENLDAKPLLYLLDELGSWPVLNDSWTDTNWKTEDEMVRFHKIFFSYIHHSRPAPIFNSYVKVDDKNSTTNIISIDQPEFTIIPRHYKSDQQRWKETFGAYETMVRDYVSLLGGNKSTADVAELLRFEMKLANASTPVSVFRDVKKSYKTMKLKDLMNVTGGKFDFKRYFEKVFEPVNFTINENTMIGTKSIEYLKVISELVVSVSKRTIANYLGWVVVYKYGPHLSVKFRQVDFKFRHVVTGVNVDTNRWLKCFEVVEDNMDMAVTKLFVQASNVRQAAKLGNEVFEGVKDTFLKRLNNLEWMDLKTKAKAITKAKRVIYDIGYPEYIELPGKLDQLYQRLEISKEFYLKNLVNSYKWRRIRNLDLIHHPVNKRLWDLAPTLVNAYYDVSNNKIVFLAGILDNPFFDVKGPMYLRYGSFGFVSGHEITHGFDDQGRLYDINGNLKDWWSLPSANAFKKKASCIEKQYSSYKYLGLNVNGNMTLGENIADIGGLKIAYKAYKQWEKKHGIEKKLPGLDLNQDQLFFLSFGQLWCSVYNEKKGMEIVQRSVHSLPNLRVIGPLKNMEEFSDAFHCPVNSPMVKKDRCKMW